MSPAVVKWLVAQFVDSKDFYNYLIAQYWNSTPQILRLVSQALQRCDTECSQGQVLVQLSGSSGTVAAQAQGNSDGKTYACVSCAVNCLTCSGSPDNCDACPSNSYLSYDSNVKPRRATCLSNCTGAMYVPQGSKTASYFDISTLSTETATFSECLPCSKYCSQCDATGSCTSCASPYLLRGD
jgi:hypothetical protein